VLFAVATDSPFPLYNGSVLLTCLNTVKTIRILMKKVMRCPSVCGPVKRVPWRPLALYLKSTVYSRFQIPV